MRKHLSARELVDKALGRKLSPEAQAVLDDLRAHIPKDPEDLDIENDMSDPMPPLNLDDEPTEDEEGEKVDDEETTETGSQDAATTEAKLTRRLQLLQSITSKLDQAKRTKTKPKPATRAASNRANAKHSTGPKTPAGKANSSTNSLKHGFFAAAASLHPQDNAAFENNVDDLRLGLHPDGPVEELLIRELAMFKTRLTRLEAAEYALICSSIETNPNDAREVAVAYTNNAQALEQLQKAEVHLRRAYNRTWDRLERMQKERHKLPLDESLKRSQVWLTAEAKRNNRPKEIPSRNPAIDEKGKLIIYPKGHPLYRPKEDDEPNPANPDSDPAEDQNN